MWRENEDTESAETDSNKMKMDRWTAKQTEVLVIVPRENYKKLECSKQHSTWVQIKEKIDNLGNPKTLIQIKTKSRNKKDTYKISKNCNKKIGWCPSFSAHFDVFNSWYKRFCESFCDTSGSKWTWQRQCWSNSNRKRWKGKNYISISHRISLVP